MNRYLLLLLFFPSFISAQYTKDEATEIIEVFHLAGLINETGLAYLTGELTDGSLLTGSIPTMGGMERNTTGGIHSAQLIRMLNKVYELETIYRSGMSIRIDLWHKAGIKDSRKLTGAPKEIMEQEWRKQMASHPGHLIELALGENALDTLEQKSKRHGAVTFGSFPFDWENYRVMIPPTTSIYEKTSVEILDLLFSLELITDEIYLNWKLDMDTNGYFLPAYILQKLAQEMGELETREPRIKANTDLIEQLVTVGMMDAENQEFILRTDSLLASSEYGVFLPFLKNTQRLNLPVDCSMKEGYPAVLAALSKIDSSLKDIAFEVRKIERPVGRDAVGEYFEVLLDGLGHSSKTIIHATENSGDIPGKPPRFLFVPVYLGVVDDLLEKAGYEKRLYTASLWRQINKDETLPSYIMLVNPANDRLITMSYVQLGLRDARR